RLLGLPLDSGDQLLAQLGPGYRLWRGIRQHARDELVLVQVVLAARASQKVRAGSGFLVGFAQRIVDKPGLNIVTQVGLFGWHGYLVRVYDVKSSHLLI